jgi:hypothetical protein
LRKFTRLARTLPLLALLGLSGCLGSTLSNLFISSVKITPANPTVAISAMQQFYLTATYVDGTTDTEPGGDVTWASSDTAVATVNKAGLATALTSGTTYIGGSFKGNNTRTLLTVSVTPADVPSAVEGDSRMLRVTNLRTRQVMTFAVNGAADSVMFSRTGASNAAGADGEISVLPERGPAWLAVDPSAKYLYVVNHTSESVSAFAIDWENGTLAQVVGSPFPAGTKPWSVEVDPDGAGLSIAHFGSAEISRFYIDPATGALTSVNTQ